MEKRENLKPRGVVCVNIGKHIRLYIVGGIGDAHPLQLLSLSRHTKENQQITTIFLWAYSSARYNNLTTPGAILMVIA
jgi:hypothetical protein